MKGVDFHWYEPMHELGTFYIRIETDPESEPATWLRKWIPALETFLTRYEDMQQAKEVVDNNGEQLVVQKPKKTRRQRKTRRKRETKQA